MDCSSLCKMDFYKGKLKDWLKKINNRRIQFNKDVALNMNSILGTAPVRRSGLAPVCTEKYQIHTKMHILISVIVLWIIGKFCIKWKCAFPWNKNERLEIKQAS